MFRIATATAMPVLLLLVRCFRLFGFGYPERVHRAVHPAETTRRSTTLVNSFVPSVLR
jgi:hypothetical protein